MGLAPREAFLRLISEREEGDARVEGAFRGLQRCLLGPPQGSGKVGLQRSLPSHLRLKGRATLGLWGGVFRSPGEQQVGEARGHGWPQGQDPDI